MTPNETLRVCIEDAAAAREVERAQRSMDTRRIARAIERRKATTHALIALQLRQGRKERENARAMGWAAE
jgi:hypothetical protein